MQHVPQLDISATSAAEFFRFTLRLCLPGNLSVQRVKCRASGSRWYKESRQSIGRLFHTQHSRRSRSRSVSPDEESAQRDRMAAVKAARARRAEEAAARADAARARDARRLADSAAAWKRPRQSRASQAMQSLHQQVRSWSFPSALASPSCCLVRS